MFHPNAPVGIPRTIWMLGFISLFMDFSSEIVRSLLPLFMITTLGSTALTVGLIEGIAEAFGLIIKIFSGAVSDYFGRRKTLLLLGYGLAAFTKPLFPLAHSAEVIFTARALDRIGKGIRGAPRDALVADVTSPDIRGAAFGLRLSIDTIGAFLGPLFAILLMVIFNENIQHVLWFAAIPGCIAVLLIFIGIHEPVRTAPVGRFRSPFQLEALRSFSKGYWWVVIVGAIFTLARFSEAFLVLRAQQLGLSLTWVPLVLVVMAGVCSLSAYPAGIWSDRIRRSTLLKWGLAALLLADLILAQANSIGMLLLGVGVWGLHMGLTQGILAAMIADTAPPELTGTAFGIFNLVCGLCFLFANLIAGWLWDNQGAQVTFFIGALLSFIAFISLVLKSSEFARDAKSS